MKLFDDLFVAERDTSVPHVFLGKNGNGSFRGHMQVNSMNSLRVSSCPHQDWWPEIASDIYHPLVIQQYQQLNLGLVDVSMAISRLSFDSHIQDNPKCGAFWIAGLQDGSQNENFRAMCGCRELHGRSSWSSPTLVAEHNEYLYIILLIPPWN